MKCPECGAWSEVKETRGTKRRRECGNGHRFSTEEVLTKSDKPAMTAERKRAIAQAEGSLKSLARIFHADPRTVKRIKQEYKNEMQLPAQQPVSLEKQ